MKHIVGLSGGKDSTALALLLREREPREYVYLITPTGDELPEMIEHWQKLETLLGTPLTRVTNGTLASLITKFGALPNWRQRWCTRILKIEPTIAWMKANAPKVYGEPTGLLYVGLRADEEEREGIYSDDVTCRFPLREWGMTEKDVWNALVERGIKIPRRTDCARCYGQRLIEWKNLWREHPELYADAEKDEAKTGATFRSPGRDTWPAGLVQLRGEFESGRKLRGEDSTPDDAVGACRVCSL